MCLLLPLMNLTSKALIGQYTRPTVYKPLKNSDMWVAMQQSGAVPTVLFYMLTFTIGSQWKPVVRVLGKSLQEGYKVQQQFNKTLLTTSRASL